MEEDPAIVRLAEKIKQESDLYKLDYYERGKVVGSLDALDLDYADYRNLETLSVQIERNLIKSQTIFNVYHHFKERHPRDRYLLRIDKPQPDRLIQGEYNVAIEKVIEVEPTESMGNKDAESYMAGWFDSIASIFFKVKKII